MIVVDIKFLAYVLAIVLGLLFMTIYFFITWIKQAFCVHNDYYEDRACDAVCRKCGKNLGFIGNVRKQRRGE